MSWTERMRATLHAYYGTPGSERHARATEVAGVAKCFIRLDGYLFLRMHRAVRP